MTANETPDTSPNFTQVIDINTSTGALSQGMAVQGVTGGSTEISPLAIDSSGSHVYGIGLTDLTCLQNCSRAVYSFSVSASNISQIGNGGVDVGSHGNDAIAASPY